MSTDFYNISLLSETAEYLWQVKSRHAYLQRKQTLQELENRTDRADRHPFNGLFFGTTCINWHEKSKTNLDFNEARDDRVAVASAGPYANHLHLAPDRQPCPHLITQFITCRMLFLTPNQQCQRTEGTNRTDTTKNYISKYTKCLESLSTDCDVTRGAVKKFWAWLLSGMLLGGTVLLPLAMTSY